MRLFFNIVYLQFIQIIVFGFLGLGVFYFTKYDDGSALRKSIDDVKVNIQQVEEQIKKKQQELEEIKVFEIELKDQEEVIQYFLNFVPSSLTFTDVSELVTKEARSAGVNIIEKKDNNQTAKNEDSEYRTLDVQLTIKGAFSQVLLFLSKLTDQKRMLIVNEINMRVDRQTRLITANLSLSAYRYEKREEAQKEENAEENK